MHKNNISRRGFLTHMTLIASGLSLSDGRTLGAAPVRFGADGAAPETLPPSTAEPARAVARPPRADLPLKIVTLQTIQPVYAKKITGYAPGIEIIRAGSPDDLMQKIVDADVLYGAPTPKLIAAGKRLKWVQVGSAGVEHYVFPEMVRSNIILTNMSGVFSLQISEHVFGLLLGLTRGINRFIAQKPQHEWRVDQLNPVEIGGMTMGIVGLGSIGTEIARRAYYGFDMKVLATDPKQLRKPGFVADLRYPSWLMQMVPQVDVLVSAAPHTRETEGMFNAKVFNAMKPSAYFINISRGKLADGPSLIQALKENRIAGAGLDVTYEEPLPKSSPLWDIPNVIITGHTSGQSQYTERRRLELFSENVRRFVTGEPLTNIIDKEKGY